MVTAVRSTSSLLQPLFAAAPVDPNEPITGPAEPSKPRASTPLSDSMGKDDFMKLLIAQLKNQDPMNPMDGKDMAAQLAQFSSVEQLIELNKAVEEQAETEQKMAEALETLQKTQTEQGDNLAQLIEGQMAVATVGKIGVVTGNGLYVDRDGNGTITVDTGTLKGSGMVVIRDMKNNVVASVPTVVSHSGMQSFELQDLNISPPLPAGEYSFAMTVTEPGKLPSAAKTYTTGRITGLRYANGNPVLVIGDTLSVPFSQLIQIRG